VPAISEAASVLNRPLESTMLFARLRGPQLSARSLSRRRSLSHLAARNSRARTASPLRWPAGTMPGYRVGPQRTGKSNV